MLWTFYFVTNSTREVSHAFSGKRRWTARYCQSDHRTVFFCIFWYIFCTKKCQKVDPAGLEPATFSMPLRRAPNCAMGPYIYVEDGPGGIRTRDLFSAIEARSQLRHRPDIPFISTVLVYHRQCNHSIWHNSCNKIIEHILHSKCMHY